MQGQGAAGAGKHAEVEESLPVEMMKPAATHLPPRCGAPEMLGRAGGQGTGPGQQVQALALMSGFS